jgi:hypothetical protein
MPPPRDALETTVMLSSQINFKIFSTGAVPDGARGKQQRLLIRNGSLPDIGRQTPRTKIEHVGLEPQKLGELHDDVIRRRPAASVLNIVQILRGYWLAIVLLYAGGDLPLGQLELLATFRNEFPKCDHTFACSKDILIPCPARCSVPGSDQLR